MSAIDDGRTLAASSRSFLDGLPLVTFVASRDGRIRYLSPHWFETTGLDRSAPPDDVFARAVAPEDRTRVLSGLRDAIAGGSPFAAELRLAGRDGTSRWVACEAAQLREPGGAGPELWFGTMIDIERYKALEFELRSQGELNALLIESTDDCIKVLDLDANVLSMSTNGQKTLGIDDVSSVLGRSWLDFWSAEDRPRAASAIETALAGEVGRFTGTFGVRGEKRWFDVIVTAMKNASGAVETLLAVSRDMTVSRTAGEALLASEQRYRRIAVELQAASLPNSLAVLENLELDAFYRPGSDEATIGGDWYDAFTLDDGRIAITIGDVLGHGLHAAVTMTKLRQSMQAAAMLQAHPIPMLTVADRTIRLIDPDAYATGLAAIYDASAQTLSIASAGHAGPLVRMPDGAIVDIEIPGPMLGLRDGSETHVLTVPIPGECTIVFFTDGLTEATRRIDEGYDRLRAALRDRTVLDAEHPARAIATHVLGDGNATDDIAVLVARVAPAGRTQETVSASVA